MSNPWSDTYKKIREPYLQEKMAKKDYDGDGKIESGKDEYMGSRDKAIKKAMGKDPKQEMKKEHHQKDADGKVIEHDDTTPSSVEEGKLGTLHVADMKGNTPAWQNRMGLNKKGQRLYSFGQDIIQKMSYEPEGEVVAEMNLKNTFKLKKGSKMQQEVDPTSSQKNDKLLQHKLGQKFDRAHYEPAKVAKPNFSNWREDFVFTDEVEEAVKRPKLDIQEKGVKNKIEVNPDDGIKEEKKN